MTRLQTGRSGGWLPAASKFCLFSIMLWVSLGHIHPPTRWKPVALPGSKATGGWSWPLSSPSAEVKNEWSYTSVPPLWHVADRDSFCSLHFNSSMPASVPCTDLHFLTYYWHRCPVWTFSSLHITGIGALYGPSVSYILLTSVHCTDLQFLTYCWHRCIVRTFSFLHTSDIGALYGPSVSYILLASMHCTDLQFLTYCWHRWTVQTFNFVHTAWLGALYRSVILLILPASVHCRVFANTIN
jgi:hypothetical protein